MGQAKTKKAGKGANRTQRPQPLGYEDVLKAALLLAPEEREALVGELIGGQVAAFDNPELERAWNAELDRRVAEARRDPSILLNGEQAFADIRARLNAPV